MESSSFGDSAGIMSWNVNSEITRADGDEVQQYGVEPLFSTPETEI